MVKHGKLIDCQPYGAAARCVAAFAKLAQQLRWARSTPLCGLAAVLLVCAVLPLVRPLGAAGVPRPERHALPHEWPHHFEGRALQPLALGLVERRFAQAFPGAIGRFTDGERLLILRFVECPTRMLHPAADCYRGLGYRIEAARLEQDTRQRLWRCFEASRGPGQPTRLRVCERIEDAAGGAFTDTSAWFWAALTERSVGPWQATTRVEVL